MLAGDFFLREPHARSGCLNSMKHVKLFIISICALLAAACQSSDLFKELPAPISKFVSQYWPNPAIASYSEPSSGEYEVVITNGPTLKFDSNYDWTEINGNGMTLPEVLLYDRLPEKLYDYLSAGSELDNVFTLVRTPRTITVTLLNTTVTYDIESQKITQS